MSGVAYELDNEKSFYQVQAEHRQMQNVILTAVDLLRRAEPPNRQELRTLARRLEEASEGRLR